MGIRLTAGSLAASAARVGPAPLDTPIDGLLFEPANVFYDDTLWRRWLLKLLGRVGVHTHYECFFRLWECQCAGDVYMGVRTFDDAMREFLHSIGLCRGMVEELLMGCRARRQADDPPRALPGVIDTLARLSRRGAILAAAANSPCTGDELRNRLTAMGISARLDAVVTSRELGCTLCEPRALETIARAMRLPAHRVAMVSSHAPQLAAAAATGMKTIAINAGPDTLADRGLPCIADLLTILPVPLALASAG
jgi:phosphoglycolate phosphatase-like HAD superfamily hydrolase